MANATGSVILTGGSSKSNAPKKSIYEIITERFIQELNQGIIPWEKPWIPLNSETRYGAWSHDKRRDGKPYSLLNQMLLPKEGEYLTFNEVKAEGGKVKKGAKASPIFVYKPVEIEVRNSETNLTEKKRVPMLRYYTVFHIDDTEGIKQNFYADENPMDALKEPEKCKEAEDVIKAYSEREEITITHKAQDRAYYSPLTDSISLPLKKQFKQKSEYYSTVFHELTHSTGASNRLKRFNGAIGDIAYSLEELVAEIGAALMLKSLGLETESSHKNNTAYIQSWLQALNNDPNMIVKASSRASKAFELITRSDNED